MIRVPFLLIGLLFASTLILQAQENERPAPSSASAWKQMPPMPTARAAARAVSAGGKILVFGGTAGEKEDHPVATVESFDPAANSWKRLKDLPGPRAFFGAAELNGRVYVTGGKDGALDEYDPKSDNWNRKAAMPTRRANLGVVSLNGKLYAIGGLIDDGSPYRNMSTVEVYDPLTGKWTSKSSMPTARHAMGVAVYREKIYVIGGAKPVGSTDSNARDVEVYDPATDSWTVRKPMPYASAYYSIATVGDRIYVIGGAGPSHVVQIYNPEKDSWSIRYNKPSKYWATAGAVSGDRVYLTGGWLDSGSASISGIVEEYTPSLENNGR